MLKLGRIWGLRVWLRREEVVLSWVRGAEGLMVFRLEWDRLGGFFSCDCQAH